MFVRIAALAGFALLGLLAVSPAQALSSHDCSVKFKAAQDAGQVGDMKYADFRKANCGSDATMNSPIVGAAATTAAKPATKPATTTADNSGEPNITNTEHAAEPAAPTTAAPRGVVFPRAVDKKYANESAGKARMHTCLDQYNANKASNSLGGLKWIQKGGGYYSLCNARLKSS
ncbi:MAG TPA: hypothetical protein VHB74_03685 [Devosia sp.]|nr:hypothetical protein [Devosia sp.]